MLLLVFLKTPLTSVYTTIIVIPTVTPTVATRKYNVEFM